MRWLSKKGKTPEDFDERKRIIFAFVPHKTVEGIWVWLEPVVSSEFWGPLTHTWRRDKYFLVPDIETVVKKQ